MGCRGCLIFLAVVFVILAVLVGGAYYFVTRPSSLVAGMPAIASSKEASDAFDRKLDAFLADLGSSKESGGEATATLAISEEEATSKLAQFIWDAQLGVEIANPQVHFRNDRIQVSGGLGSGWATVNLAVEVQVESRDGKLDLTVGKVDFGRFGVPEAIQRQVIEAITKGAGSLKFEELPMEIGSIDVADGQLVIRDVKLP